MRAFAALYDALDATTSTDRKVEAMADYFANADHADAAWAVTILAGGKLKRVVSAPDLRAWATAEAGIEPWLFEESYAVAGDLAETISLLLGSEPAASTGGAAAEDAGLADWIETRILPLKDAEPSERETAVRAWFTGLDRPQLFLLVKLLTGALRVGVSRTLVERALARVAGVPADAIAHRLMGVWTPTPAAFAALLSPAVEDVAISRPYPFFLATPIQPESTVEPGPDEVAAMLGERALWQAEWKYDGIRAQVIRRGGQVFLWSRGEENITDRFPEIVHAAAASLPDGCVLDGELLAWRGDAPLPFGVLQQRIGRTTLSVKVLREAPAAFVAYDLLERGGEDVRARALAERRPLLQATLPAGHERLRLAPVVTEGSWPALAAARDESRDRGVEGLMLKRLSSPYAVGRRVGDWWKWKVRPHTIDAVLTYAQPGHGKRANLLTDHTFAVWDGPADRRELVTVAKAYSGLTNEELTELDRWIRAHTVERFGPARRVEPVLVFELAFDSVQASGRHKSGVAMRFPRIARWRRDKPASEADTLDAVRALIRAEPA